MSKKDQPKPNVPLTQEEYIDLSFLVLHLGETTTAAIADVKPSVVYDWINHPSNEAPDSVQLQRILSAKDICADVVRFQGPTLTRKWFLEESGPKGSDPASLIRDGHVDKVRQSAKIFKQENR